MISPAAAALAGFAVLAAVQATPPASQRPQPPRAATAPQPLFPEEPVPTEQVLGVAVYPGAVFLTSYEAGKGQRFYLYGSTAGYTELIAYYRTLLKQRGTAVFENPATHIFEVGKYDENAMAFPPSVTIKDYTSGGTGGYLSSKPERSPERFPTVIQIVPIQPATERGRADYSRPGPPDAEVALRQLGSEHEARADVAQDRASAGHGVCPS